VNEAVADDRADRIAALATGVGVGLMTFMLTWTIAARITERMLATPTSAYVAMVGALCAGAVVTILTGRRLSNTSRAQRS
jgi:hypothetical protein